MSVLETINRSGAGIDLTPRFVRSSTVAASPAAGSETTICSLTIPSNCVQGLGIELVGWAAYTIGTNGVSVNLKIRQTGTSGATIAATGLITSTAANLDSRFVMGLDTAGVIPGQVYVLTMLVTSGSAPSTVSACYLRALIV